MAQIGLFDDPARTDFKALKAMRAMEMMNHLQEAKQKVLLAEDSIKHGQNPELVVSRLLTDLRWGHLETMNLPRPTTGDLFQAINTALRFVVTSQMPVYKVSDNEKTIMQKPLKERMCKDEADKALHLLRRAHDVYGGFCLMLDELQSRQSEPWYISLQHLKSEIENGL